MSQVLLKHFIYVADPGFIFGYVPKVACTNWKSVFRRMAGYSDYLDAALAHDREKGGLVYLSDVPDAFELLSDSRIPKYAFVRNPFSRVLSAYLNKIEPLASGSGEWLGRPFHAIFDVIDEFRASHGAEHGVSFGIFLQWLAESGDVLTEDEHWTSQSRILSPSIVRYDFLGRFENLDHDVSFAMSLMKCPGTFPTREDLDFPATNSQRVLDAYYSPKEIDLVGRIYAEDFAAFGYSDAELPR